MGNTTNTCSHASVRKKVPEYLTRDFGIALSLVDAVEQEICSLCGEVMELTIPNPSGLVAAAALYRVKLPQKLTGSEIRFVRKALKYSAKKLADVLGATAETISRWENDKMPMSPTTEKLLRILTGTFLTGRAPAVTFDPQEILDMKINAVRSPGEEIALSLRLLYFKKPDVKAPTEEYSEAA